MQQGFAGTTCLDAILIPKFFAQMHFPAAQRNFVKDRCARIFTRAGARSLTAQGNQQCQQL
ncbi:hypothetical protein C9I56_35400 [Paraburkholderia caribensis]|nr:hypothetical protein C9I56_35400 [Paraburkholderia caribensis]